MASFGKNTRSRGKSFRLRNAAAEVGMAFQEMATERTQMATPREHDSLFRRCFAHRVMVEHLLVGFVPDFDPAMFRLDTLQRLDPSHTPERSSSRYGDRAWRVDEADRDAVMCIWLEFQARPDNLMAPRINQYIAGLIIELSKGQVYSAAGKLPFLLPLLIYSGQGKWSNATSLAELLEVPPARYLKYQPALLYQLVGTQSQVAQLDLDQKMNFAAVLFTMQHASKPGEIGQVLQKALEPLREGDYPGLEADLVAFACWRLRLQAAGRRVPEYKAIEEVLGVVEEQELWIETARREGEVEGERKMVRLLIETQLGDVPEWAIARLSSATEEDLLRWAPQLAGRTATVEELLGPPAADPDKPPPTGPEKPDAP